MLQTVPVSQYFRALNDQASFLRVIVDKAAGNERKPRIATNLAVKKEPSLTGSVYQRPIRSHSRRSLLPGFTHDTDQHSDSRRRDETNDQVENIDRPRETRRTKPLYDSEC